MKARLLVIISILISVFLQGHARNDADSVKSDSSVVMRFRIFYPVNKAELHEDYMDNAHTLHRIQKYLEKSPRIDCITIYSYASPEGPYHLNKRLATERGKTAKQYLLKHLPAHRHLPDSLIIIDPTAENWEGLRDLVLYQYPHVDKDEVLAILDRKDITDERRKVLLKRLHAGKPWLYILEHLMPQLRYATWVSVWQRIEADRVVEEPTRLAMEMPAISNPDIPFVPFPMPEIEKEDTFMLAVKTNLLYDAVTALNVELEVPIGNHWSVMVEDIFPWWETGNKYCLQLWEMGFEGRYWFRNNMYHSQKLKGHFAGVYAMSGKYDFQKDHDLCYQGKFWSAGVTYGYVQPIANWCRLEYSLSMGLLNTHYERYQPSPDYEHLYRNPVKAGKSSILGPTKLKVTLVVTIKMKWRASR